MVRLDELSSHFGKTDIQDFLENRLSAYLSEPDVEKTARYSKIRNHVAHADAFAGVFGNVATEATGSDMVTTVNYHSSGSL